MEDFSPHPSFQLDVLGFYCPVPLRTLMEQLQHLDSGDVVLMIADDPETQYDIPPYLEREGHTLHQIVEQHGEYYFVIEVM